MKFVTKILKSGGLHEKRVVATWNLGNHLSICLQTQGNQEKPVSRWPVAGPSEYWLIASSPASKVETVLQALVAPLLVSVLYERYNFRVMQTVCLVWHSVLANFVTDSRLISWPQVVGGGACLNCRCYKTLAHWRFKTSEVQLLAEVWGSRTQRGEQQLACAVGLQWETVLQRIEINTYGGNNVMHTSAATVHSAGPCKKR